MSVVKYWAYIESQLRSEQKTELPTPKPDDDFVPLTREQKQAIHDKVFGNRKESA